MIRITESTYIAGTVFNEPVVIEAPDVTLDGVRINGTNREDILLTMFHGTKLLNSTLLGSPQGAHRGIRADAVGCRVDKTRVLNIFSDAQTQALAGWEGCADLRVTNSELEASGQSAIFGGAFCGHEKLIPQDILFENVILSKNRRWLSDPSIACVNNFEIKNGKRIKLIGCTLRGSVPGGGQDGYAIVLTVRQDPAPYCTIEDVEIRDCEIDDTLGGVQIMGQDDMHAQGYGDGLKNVLITGNRFRNMTQWRMFMINRGSKNLRILGNSIHGENLNTIITFTGSREFLSEGFEFVGNDVPEGHYGIKGDGNEALGVATLEAYAPGYVWADNTVRDQGGYVTYP